MKGRAPLNVGGHDGIRSFLAFAVAHRRFTTLRGIPP